jgi:hypothetical protein
MRKKNDPVKQREAYARWKAAHPERVLELNRKWKAEHKEKCRAWAKKWGADHPEVIKRLQKEWNDKNHHKVRAEQRAQDHIPLKDRCEICGEKATCRHHPDYAKPLEVLHLCDKCHMSFHPRPNKKEFTHVG